MLLKKNGLVIDSWDEAREYSGFVSTAREKAGGDGLIVLSLARTAANTTILRDDIPRSFLCDTSILSRKRLDRLIEQQVICASPRFGMVVSNGSGLGHVARMQAVANGLKQFGPAAFMSFSPALVKGASYLPSTQYLDLPDELARGYVHEASLRFFNAFDPTHIIYDGNVIPPGLLSALSLRPEIHLTWIRRGQWPADVAAKYMAGQALCDLVIEPGDLADAYDTGPTWQKRHEFCPPQKFLKTKPIKPANPETLTRAEARTKLGLQPDGNYMLLMLGANTHAEDINIVHQCVSAINQNGAVPVIAHWPMSRAQAPQIDGAIVIETMPIAPFYPAFDAIISAAGYNSFHELIEVGLPTVFVPQEDEGRDSQLARAQYAVDHGLAALCRRSGLHFLSEILSMLEVPARKAINWHDDWDGMADAMGITQKTPSDIAHFSANLSLPDKLFMDMHERWLKKNRPFKTEFLLALNIPTEQFFMKKVNSKTVVVTNSVDPAQLRRAGFQYLWVNAGTDYALKRQFLNWLSVWRPSRIKSI